MLCQKISIFSMPFLIHIHTAKKMKIIYSLQCCFCNANSSTLYFYSISKSNIGRITGCIPAAVVKLTIYGLIKEIKILEPLFFKIFL